MDNETSKPAPYKTLETGARRSARVAFDDPTGAPVRFDLCTSEGQLGHSMADLGMLACFERHRPDLDRRPAASPQR